MRTKLTVSAASAVLIAALLLFSSCTSEEIKKPLPPEPGPEPETGVFEKGTGDEGNPYVISTLQQYEYFVDCINSAETYAEYADRYYLVGADLDFDGKAVGVVAGSSGRPFKGVFDGGSHRFSGFAVNTSVQSAAGMFGYTDGAEIRNIVMENASVNGDYAFTGAIVGEARNTVIDNISFSGNIRSYRKEIVVEAADYAPVASNNAGYCGGLVGLLYKSTLSNASFNGTATFYGKFSGGLVGCSYNSTVSSCSVAKENTINIYYHYCGGIVGRAYGADNIVEKCSFEGSLTATGYCNGGIVGQLLGGTVRECVTGSYAYIGGDKFFVGGIAGSIQPLAEVTVSACAAYGSVQGAYSVGGIAGYAGIGTGAKTDGDLILKASADATISSCASEGATLTATGGNSNKYPIVGGIVGWIHNLGAVTVDGCYSRPGLIQTTYGANVNGVLCGVCAYSNGDGDATISNCYSSFTVSDLLVCNDRADTDPSRWYAAIHIRCTKATAIRNCFNEESLRLGYSSGAATETGCGQFTQTELTDGTLLSKLQSTATGTQWVASAAGYPVQANRPADPNVKPKAAKRVSIIGDSISTFKGWIPGGYSAHYPATDGTLTLANETWWYRLVHDNMKSAELDMNISFSGSTVTNTTAENYAAKYGSASNAWWHNSFTERFAACGGMGRPDIIIIHGGTNDWAHNADPLAPGLAIRNDASNIYGGDAPSDEAMAAIYAVADAATTRDAVNALPDGTFCEAYCKLLCQVRERYPRCKVVCLIGDYLSSSVEQSVLKMAEHYGAKSVNLFRVNGFNDLGGYSPSTLSNKGTQPNMPKHDYSGDVGGCHPASGAMKFIADKIYSELGSWLEE